MTDEPKDKEIVVLPPHQIQKGETLNPDGRPKGAKNARTVVRDFMNNKIESLKGTRVTRFQYLLLSMYEINLDLMKQVEYRKGEVKFAEDELRQAKDDGSGRAIGKARKDLRQRNKELEKILEQVQVSQGRLSEFFLKASGQYLEKKEIENKINQPITIDVNEKDLAAAVLEINGEF